MTDSLSNHPVHSAGSDECDQTPADVAASDKPAAGASAGAAMLASAVWDCSPRAIGATATVGDVIKILERRYPLRGAESWDANGLVCGSRRDRAARVLYAIDPIAEVVDEAIDGEYDLLVVHHPLLLKGVHGISADGYKGELLHRLIRAKCALYTAHTNADCAQPGVSDALARALGLDNLRPLVPATADQSCKVIVTVPASHVEPVIDAMAEAGAGSLGNYGRCVWSVDGIGSFEPLAGAQPAVGEVGRRETVMERRVEMFVAHAHLSDVIQAIRQTHPYEHPAIDAFALHTERGSATTGLGRVGELSEPTTLERFAQTVAKSLRYTPQGIRVAGPAEATVHTVAVCGGSGDSFFDAVRASGADVYVTADLRHHPASEFCEAAGPDGPFLIDVPHWASEWPWLHGCASAVAADLVAQGLGVEYAVSTVRSDPWTFRVASSGGLVR